MSVDRTNTRQKIRKARQMIRKMQDSSYVYYVKNGKIIVLKCYSGRRKGRPRIF